MKQKISYNQAFSLATRIKEELSESCLKIEIAGSIRRKRPIIGDIEIVAIPKMSCDLFDNPSISILDLHLLELVQAGRLKPIKDGDRYKQFKIPANNMNLDLFLPLSECWPIIYAIRTGSREFSKKLVTQRNKGGLLPSHLQVKGGQVWQNGQALPLETEKQFLQLCGGWVAPEDRG